MDHTAYCLGCGTALGSDHFCSACGTAAGSVPATGTPPAPSAPTDRNVPVACILAGAGMVLGAFLPWVKITAPFVGSMTTSGIDGGDGWVAVVAGLVVAFAGWSVFSGSVTSTARSLVLIGAVVAGGLALFEYADISSRFAEVRSDMDAEGSVFGVSPSDLVDTAYGAGLHLITASAAAAFVLGLRLPAARAVVVAQGVRS
ncbi:MAG: hypothetical protein ACRD03_09520 [Acidimicrobiales bacterium]